MVALDQSFNFSEFSEVLAVSLPDTIGPAASILSKPRLNGSDMVLSWTESVSKDISFYAIEQKINAAWMEIAKINSPSLTEYLISDLPNGFYEFRIVGIDTSGNRGRPSRSRIIHVKQIDSDQSINLSIQKLKDHISLSWNSIPAKYYRIYRMTLGGRSKLVSMTDQLTYRDQGAQKGNTYMYYVVAQNKNGRKVKKSETITIEY